MKLGYLIAAACVAATTATAHATLEVQQAEAGSTYKGVMRIGHGCDGEATQRVDITVPEGVISVKPMPKPGWTLTTETGAYAQSYDYYGRTLTEGVRTITWEGRLDDGHYDEFIFRAKLAGDWEDGTMIHFPTVQTCANGTADWTVIPATGQDPHDIDNPAPGLMIKAGHGGHNH
ncbi:MAG: YcnI family protein [Pseudomonadota bacterium]